LRICSRHFRKEDFRHSVIESKRYLKKGAIPSLYLNERSKNDDHFPSPDATTKENQLIGTVNKYTVETTEIKSLSIEKSEIKSEKDDQLSHIIGNDNEVGDKRINTQFISQECYSESSVPEK